MLATEPGGSLRIRALSGATPARLGRAAVGQVLAVFSKGQISGAALAREGIRRENWIAGTPIPIHLLVSV